MFTVADVEFYVQENILHSEGWDELSQPKKDKALKNAMNTLTEYLGNIYQSEIPIFDVVEQVFFVIRKDDNMFKAEMGLKGMGVDGISMSFDEITPIAPSLLTKYGLTKETIASSKRRRVGSYSVPKQDTFRTWG